VVEIALSPPFKGANYSHFTELIAEMNKIFLSVSSVSRILRKAHIHSPRKYRRAKYRKSRKRKAQEGIMVLIDASPHAWFEDRGPISSLHAIIDDATGKLLGATFRENEDATGYFIVLYQMISTYGVPLSIYSDRHASLVSYRADQLTIEEELAGETVSYTQVGRALKDLGIQHLKALSPQAKGRIERLFLTLQDRLIIEMRLHTISDIDAANGFLPSFMKKFNKRFAVEPDSLEKAYMQAPSKDILRNTLCQQEARKASKGSTVSYGGKTYQLIKEKNAVVELAPKSSVTILTFNDGKLGSLYKDKFFKLKEFEVKKPPAKSKTTTPALIKPKLPVKPSANHPWRTYSINKKSTRNYIEYQKVFT
jgi:hypothetical protein